MCFSATASFTVAAATAAAGIATARLVDRPRHLPLAAVPFLFAAQQAIEGLLWIRLGGGSGVTLGGVDIAMPSVSHLAFGFLLFAVVLWPAYTAVAVWMVEPDRRRRQVLVVIALFGAALSLHLLAGLIGHMPEVSVRGQSIWYASTVDPLSWKLLPYLVCTCTPLLVSSHRMLQIFGLVVVVGFAVSATVYAATFISVWCFFAAADSVLLYFFFKRRAMAVGLGAER